MEIHQLALLVSEQDLNQIARRHLPDDFAVKDFKIEITAEGVRLTGKYHLFVKVRFETVWELEVVGGKVSARLIKAKALGLPVTVFVNKFLQLLRETLRKEPWLDQNQDTLIIDVEKLLEVEGFVVRMNLQSLRIQEEGLFLQAGHGMLPQDPAI